MNRWKLGRVTDFKRLLLKIQLGLETNPASATFIGRAFPKLSFVNCVLELQTPIPHGSWDLRPDCPQPPFQPKICGQTLEQMSAAPCQWETHPHPVRKLASWGELSSVPVSSLFCLYPPYPVGPASPQPLLMGEERCDRNHKARAYPPIKAGKRKEKGPH